MFNIESLKPGDKVLLPIYPLTVPMEGTVVYVHPEKRYFRVAFDTPHGETVYECYASAGPIVP